MARLDPVSILGPGGAIARRLPSYEHRSEQLAMAEAVARAIERPGHLIVEAGTGVGKSFAYLVPAIQATADPKTKVVVSTHTIALQEQLLSKDIPFLRSVMPQEFSAVLVKGRSNYISLRRLDVAIQRQDRCSSGPRRSTSSSRSGCGRAGPATAAAPTWTSDRCPASGRPCRARTATAWAASARSHKECFFYKARRRMRIGQRAGRQPRAVRHRPGPAGRRASGCCPTTRSPMIDEAHTLEAVAGEHLGLQLTSLGRRLHAGAAVQRADAQGPAVGASTTARRGDPAGAGDPGRRPRTSSTGSPTGISASPRASTAGSGSRSAGASPSARSCAGSPTAIDQGAQADREARGPDRADRRRGAVPVAGRPDRELDAAIGRGLPSTGSRSRTRPGAGSGWPRPRWTSAPACATCCSPRSPPAC